MLFLKIIITRLTHFVKRRRFYLKLIKKVYKKIRKINFQKKEKKELIDWCNSLAIKENDAITRYFDKNNLGMNITNLYSKEIDDVINKEKKCTNKLEGIESINIIYAINETLKSKRILEITINCSWSSIAILLSISEREGFLYSACPNHSRKNNNIFEEVLIPEKFKKNWKLFQYKQNKALSKIFLEETNFDFIHFNSNKKTYGSMRTYKKLWLKLKYGGIFMSEDIVNNSDFKNFCGKNNLKPIIIDFDDKYIGIIIKE